MPRRKLKVYMCSAIPDKPMLRELYTRLMSEEWILPWLDEEDILPGQDKEYETKKALDSTDLVTVCFSSKSVKNKGTFQKELKNILTKADEQPEGGIFVIPVQLDEKCKVPIRFERYGVFKYYDGGISYQTLRTSLKNCAKSLKIKVDNVSVYENNNKNTPTIIREEDIAFVNGRLLEMFFDLEPQIFINNIIYYLPSFLNIGYGSIIVRYFAGGDRIVIELPDRSARDFLDRAKSGDPFLFGLLKLRDYRLLDKPIISSM